MKLRVILNFIAAGAIMPRRSNRSRLILALAAFGAAAFAAPSFADNAMPSVQFQDGRFEPANVVVPANKPFKVQVTNSAGSAIEFESFELHRERVVRPGETITVYMPPLSPGAYEFFDDFNHAVPKGQIVSR
jgi:hypothetical protein